MSLKSKLLSLAAAVAISFSPHIGKEEPIPPPGRRCFEHYEYVVDSFKTPKSVASFLRNYIAYKSDQWCLMRDPVTGWPFINPGDWLRTPFQTFRSGEGDCEDYSYLACDLLKRNGYSPQIIAYFTSRPGQGHAVCVLKEDKVYSCVDQSRYSTGFKSIGDLVNSLNPDWQMIYAVRRDPGSITNMTKDLMFLKKDGKAVLPVYY